MPARPARVLVLGATGYLGRHLTRRLVAAGHDVTALVRSPEAPLPPGVRAEHGDATVPADLRGALTAEVGAVVDLVPPSADPVVDLAAKAALVSALAEVPGRAYVYTSGVWVLGPTGRSTADETTPTRPIDIVAHRPAVEQQVLSGAATGVRTTVIRPGVVHGHGGGIPSLLVDLARTHGRGRYVGDQEAPRWPMVQVDDLADLYVLALTHAPARSVLHAVAEPGVDTRKLAAAAATAAGLDDHDPLGWPLAEAVLTLGSPFAEALACDQVVTAPAAHAIGWRPSRASAVADVAAGSCPDSVPWL